MEGAPGLNSNDPKHSKHPQSMHRGMQNALITLRPAADRKCSQRKAGRSPGHGPTTNLSHPHRMALWGFPKIGGGGGGYLLGALVIRGSYDLGAYTRGPYLANPHILLVNRAFRFLGYDLDAAMKVRALEPPPRKRSRQLQQPRRHVSPRCQTTVPGEPPRTP